MIVSAVILRFIPKDSFECCFNGYCDGLFQDSFQKLNSGFISTI